MYHQHLELHNLAWQVPTKIMDDRVNAKRYMDFSEEFLRPIMSNFFPDGIFLLQEGNVPIHNARVS